MSSDLFLAIVNQDAQDAARILEDGWRPPLIRPSASRPYAAPVPDYACWTQVIMRDWAEGLQLLDHYLPDLTRHAEIWNMAVRTASTQCMDMLWTLRGMSADTFSESDREHCLIGLFAAMGEIWSPPHEIRDIRPALAMLARKGVRLDGIFPGEFESGDLRMAGHSLLTRAISIRRWDVVWFLWEAFWGGDPQRPVASPADPTVSGQVVSGQVVSGQVLPTTTDLPPCPPFATLEPLMLAWPRLDEVLLQAMQVVVGDYAILNAGPLDEVYSGVLASAATHALPGGRLSDLLPPDSAVAPPSPATRPEARLLVTWLGRTTHWPALDTVVRLSAPATDRLSAWLRLPLHLPEHRSVVWDVWARVLAQDPDRIWLFVTALDPNDRDAQAVLSCLSAERPDLWATYWEAPRADGLSPAAVWEEMGGIPFRSGDIP